MRRVLWGVTAAVAGLLCAAAVRPEAPSQAAAPPPTRGGVKASPQSLRIPFTVDAAQKWQKTGVIVDATVSVDVVYDSGRWMTVPGVVVEYSTGTGYSWLNPAPLGYVKQDAPVGSLLGRVNPGNGARPFYLGDNGHVPDGLSGELELIANDDYYGVTGAGFTDNAGSLNVSIYVSTR